MALRHRESARMAGMVVGFSLFRAGAGLLRFDLISLFREYSLLAAIRGHGPIALGVAWSLVANRWEACPVGSAGPAHRSSARCHNPPRSCPRVRRVGNYGRQWTLDRDKPAKPV